MQFSMKTQTVLLLVILYAFLAGCNGSNVNEPGGTMGKLVVRVGDDPFPIDLIEEAQVTITKIEARRDTGDSGSPFILLSEDTLTFNLLDLQNGVTELLVEIDVPAGNYDLVRLFVEKAEIKVKDNPEIFDIKVPSGMQTGIKIFIDPSIEVVGGLSSEVLLDFDLQKSFVVQGNPNTPAGIKGFSFKPVIRAVNMSEAGRITGVVTDTSAALLENAEVWAEQDSVISTTFTDQSGNYALIGLLEGVYSLHVTKAEYDTVSLSEVEVVAGNQTQLDLELTPTQ